MNKFQWPIILIVFLMIGCETSHENQPLKTADPFLSFFWDRKIRTIYAHDLPPIVDSTTLDPDGNFQEIYFHGQLVKRQLFGRNHTLQRVMQWGHGHSNYLMSYDTIAGNVIQKWGKLKTFDWEQDTLVQDCEDRYTIYSTSADGRAFQVIEYPYLTITINEFDKHNNLVYSRMENALGSKVDRRYFYKNDALIRIEELLNGKLHSAHYFSDLMDSTVFFKSEADRYSITYSYRFY